MDNLSAKVALKQLIKTSGIEILHNGKQCMSVLKDMAPKDKDGLENIQVAFDKNLQVLLIDADLKSTSEKQNAIDTMYNRLISRLNEQTAREICDIFVFALGWNISVKTSTPSAVPVQNKTQTYTQPKQMQYQSPIQPKKKSSNPSAFPKVAIVGVCSIVIIIGGIALFPGKGDIKDSSENQMSNTSLNYATDYSQSETNNEDEERDGDSSDVSNNIQTTTYEEENYTENPDTNNSIASPLNIEAISEVQTSIERIEIQQISDKISSDKEKKSYEFVSTEEGRYRFELSDIPNDIHFRMYLYNSDMEQLQYGEYKANGNGLTCDLNANTQYYIVVEQQKNTGSYTLNIGTQKKTMDISNCTELNDAIQYTDQRNMYSFTSAEEGRYRFELSNIPNDIYFRMYLYNSDMEQLQYGEYKANGNGLTCDLNANTQYYIVVEQQKNSGSYTLNTGSQKKTVDISNYSVLKDSMQYTDQRNVYSFTPTQTEKYIFELSDLPNDTYFRMYLYNADMEQFQFGEYRGNGGNITYDLNMNSQYYIVVEQQKNFGNYTMSYGIYKEE